MSLPFHSIPFHNDTNTHMDNNHRNQRSLLSSPLPPSPVTPLDLNSTQHLIYKQFRFRSTTDLDSLPTSSSSYYNNHRSLMTKLRMRLGSATTTIIVPFFLILIFVVHDWLWCLIFWDVIFSFRLLFGFGNFIPLALDPWKYESNTCRNWHSREHVFVVIDGERWLKKVGGGSRCQQQSCNKEHLDSKLTVNYNDLKLLWRMCKNMIPTRTSVPYTIVLWT